MTRLGKVKALDLWAIKTQLRKRSIEILVPQGELHIRSGSLKVKLQRSNRSSTSLESGAGVRDLA
ncbi:MAG: hypothetical protein N2A40_07735 [Desulfobulbaceae bacterium]